MRKNINDSWPKTFCEEEERIYGNPKRIHLSPKGVYLLLACFLLVNGAVAAKSYFEVKEKTHWDGAGDTWTCKKCGTKNYNWQISCAGCR